MFIYYLLNTQTSHNIYMLRIIVTQHKRTQNNCNMNFWQWEINKVLSYLILPWLVQNKLTANTV